MWEIIFGRLAVAAGLAAALLWLRACFVRVALNTAPDADGFIGAGLVVVDDKGRHTDPIATAARANVWNAWAAGVTAGAALFQAASLAAHRLGV